MRDSGTLPDRKQTLALFRDLRRTGRSEVRARLIEMYLGFVEVLARKFVDRGEPLEDLIQQGVIGLIHAVDRFDPDRGVQFETYAAPLILGELKRHFRDRGWAMKVPRYLRELNVQVRHAHERLMQQYERAPTATEVANELGTTEEKVLEALEVGQAYDVMSLDTGLPRADGEDEGLMAERVGLLDTSLEDCDTRASLEAALSTLDDRQQRIIWYRYYDDLSQTEVARREGISQMHVSRLQRRALQQMHAFLVS